MGAARSRDGGACAVNCIMAVGDAKQFVYRYNGDPDSEEVEVDHEGLIPIPRSGEFMIRQGKQWRIVHKLIEPPEPPDGLPIVRIFLTDHLQ
jgi:hypothetical protein